ncbi:MAG: HNH endonuclease [Pirellulales bacterium]
MPRRLWTRDETLVAFNIYCRTPFGKLHKSNPDILAVAAVLGRSANSVAMKCCNLAACDAAQQARGISGLSGASSMDRQIWREFELDPERVAFDAELAYASLLSQPPRQAAEVEWEDVAGLDIEVTAKVRVNQSFFRSLILAGYRAECAVCELPFPPLLVASHIVPWAEDKRLRMDPRNGICLCALHDKAFDRGLLLIGGDYKISLADELAAAKRLPSVAANFGRFAGESLRLPDRWWPAPELLQKRINAI